MSRSHEGAGNFPTVWPEDSQRHDEMELEILQAERSGARYVAAAECKSADSTQPSDTSGAPDAQPVLRYGGNRTNNEPVIID